MESLERLKGLHDDLAAFSETRLVHVERLWAELEVSIEDFRRLLDKPSKNNTSRESLSKGKLKADGQEYQISEAFQQGALQVADALDIDEIEAATLFLEAQTKSHLPAQSLSFTVVENFHNRRDLLLHALWLILRESQELENEDGQQSRMQEAVLHILNIKDGTLSNGSVFAGRCVAAMRDIEVWQTRLSEQAQKATVLGLSQGPEAPPILDFQRVSLLKQHEALGACLYYLFKGNYTRVHDLHRLLDAPKRFDRVDVTVIHYIPAFAAAFARYGSSDQSGTLSEAKSLHKAITGDTLKKAFSISLQPLQAVLCLLWVCEYSSCYREGMVNAVHRESDKEAAERAQLVKTALDDGALTLLLSVCTSMADDKRHHPARYELATLLLNDGTYSVLEGGPPSRSFSHLFMECLEAFSESWITNMPDSIRQLKNEEDDRRLQHITAMQDGISANLQGDSHIRLHLECFLVLISFAFEHRQDAAEVFWAEPEGNLFGFLQWASKRQTVPRVSAFCEMLCAISEGQYAEHAHHFLLDDSSSTSPVRARKSPSMNYTQIFAELELYAVKVNERSSAGQSVPNLRKVLPTDMNELESPVMLSCYLRLIAYICKQSSTARHFILEHPSFNLVHISLTLCSGLVPSYLRASVFTSLESLLVLKSLALGYWSWITLDEWATHGVSPRPPNAPRSSQNSGPSLQSLHQTLDAIGTSFDQYSSFTTLLCALVTPGCDQNIHHVLSFPDDLGAKYRVPGIEPYVDFVCGTLFTKKLSELPDETQTRVFRFHCLDFMAIAIETFNESLVAIATQSRLLSDADSFVTDYVRKHPFSRVMEWLFNEDVIRVLLGGLHLHFDEIETLPPDAIETAVLSRSLDILTMALDLQPTYLEIVRPLVRKSGRFPLAAGSAISTVEDIVASHPEIISDLARYAGTCHCPVVLRSLALLQKLSCCTRLNPSNLGANAKFSKRRMVDILSYESDFHLIPQAMSLRMRTDFRELEAGADAFGYHIKDGVLTFLINCLTFQNDLPGIAHLFLGFTRVGESLVFGPNDVLENNGSLCTAIVQLVESYPDGEGATFKSWLMHVKTSAFHVLRQLWTSPLSSTILLTELRSLHFLASQFARQASISSETQWDGRLISDPMFWLESSADAFIEFLVYRKFLYEYAVTEMRNAMHAKSTALKSQILSTLQGTSIEPANGTTVAHVSILDLFDIANIDIGRKIELPQLATIPVADLQSCIHRSSDDPGTIYDVRAVEELIQLAFYQTCQPGKDASSYDEDRMKHEADALLDFVKASNQWTLVRMARVQALRIWVELVVLTVQCWPSDKESRTQFALSIMQFVNPRLDLYLVDEAEEAIELLRLADVLVASMADLPASSTHGRTGKVIVARQLQLFQTSIDSIPAPSTTPCLRSLFYSICARFLGHVKRLPDASSGTRRQCFRHVKTTGVALVNILSDDAENGQENCRLPALALLTLLTYIARQETSTFLVDSLVKINILEELLNSIRALPVDLREAGSQDRIFVMEALPAKFALLLEISRSRKGAGYLLEAGMLQAIRDSGLCRADPDLGLAIDEPMKLQIYYELLALTLRLLVSVFLSRGLQNQQSQHQIRSFLAESRPNVFGALKRHRGLSGEVPSGCRRFLDDVVKSYFALISMGEFLEFEESSFDNRSMQNGFS